MCFSELSPQHAPREAAVLLRARMASAARLEARASSGPRTIESRALERCAKICAGRCPHARRLRKLSIVPGTYTTHPSIHSRASNGPVVAARKAAWCIPGSFASITHEIPRAALNFPPTPAHGSMPGPVVSRSYQTQEYRKEHTPSNFVHRTYPVHRIMRMHGETTVK